MKPSDFFIPLNLPDIHYELESADLEKLLTLPSGHDFFDARSFKIPKSVIEVSNKLNLTLLDKFTLLFKIVPKYDSAIHTDGRNETQRRYIGINWVWNAEDTYMSWYKLKSNDPNKIKVKKFDDKPIPFYARKNTIKLHSENLTGCNLVNLNYPHNITNNSNNVRYALSLGFKESLTWEDAKNLVKKNGLLR